MSVEERFRERFREAVLARAGRLTERDAVNGTIALGDDWYMLVLYGSATYARYGTGKVILRRRARPTTNSAALRVVDERVIEGDVAQAIIAAGEAGAAFAMINMARGYLGLPDVKELPF
jgi:hypothetical protein